MENHLNQARIWNPNEAINLVGKLRPQKELMGYKQVLQTIQIIVPEKVYYPHKTTNLLLFFLYQTVKRNPQIKNAIDIGAGAGLHSILLAKLEILVTAIDIMQEACRAIMLNSKNNHIQQNIRVIQTDLLDGINEKYDLIIANLATSPTPPLNHQLHHLAGGITIDGGFDGRFYLDQVLTQIDAISNPNGFVLLSQTNTSNIGKTERFLTEKGYHFAKTLLLTEAGEHTQKMEKFINENLDEDCHLKCIGGKCYYDIAVFVARKID